MNLEIELFQKDVVKELQAIRKNMEIVAKTAITQEKAERVKLGLSSLAGEFPECKNKEVFDTAVSAIKSYAEDGTSIARKPVAYLSGPISSDMDGYQAKFAKAEEIVKRTGRVVLKPSILPIGLSELSYMRIGLAMVEAADEIVLLDGWEHSDGAKIEMLYAKRIGKHVRGIWEMEAETHG